MINVEANDSENFNPRGMGVNMLPCFICHEGGPDTPQWDMSAFVDSKDAGERVLAMFGQAEILAKLDYRPYEPNWVQVKLGSCDTHVSQLGRLHEATQATRRISLGLIMEALTPASPNNDTGVDDSGNPGDELPSIF